MCCNVILFFFCCGSLLCPPSSSLLFCGATSWYLQIQTISLDQVGLTKSPYWTVLNLISTLPSMYSQQNMLEVKRNLPKELLLYKVYCLLLTVHCLLSTVYGLLSTVYCLLSTVYCLLSNWTNWRRMDGQTDVSPSVTAVQQVFNPYNQFFPQLELYSQF